MMDVTLPVQVIIIMCALISPAGDGVNYYIDGIEMSGGNDIDVAYCMPQKDGRTTKYYEYKEDGDLDFVFSLERHEKNPLLYTFHTEDAESIRINLADYIDQDDITRLELNKEPSLTITLHGEAGEMEILNIGVVTYLWVDAYNKIVFSIHE
ncbi:MAG: hypothetical protein JW881_21960 [Spirochaetales bacterium]|nr:hypothetical protein [Spirochaetales bacterium]